MAKQIVFFAEIKSPPFEPEARFEIGGVLRAFQEGEILGAPMVKPVRQIGRQCYEIRYGTAEHNWRVYLAVRSDIAVLAIEDKKRDSIPKSTVNVCKSRLQAYARAEREFAKSNREAP
jgi:phage-related protein